MSLDVKVDGEGNTIQDRIITSVRGQQVIVSASVINSLLFIEKPPPVPHILYDKVKFFKTLRPGEPVGELKFSPIVMPPIYRALWYIYSRNLVQKGKNFTHFNSTDYGVFASLINKVPFNIGHWVYQEMKKFRFESSPSATIPYPNLVSLILFTNKIWYLDTMEKPIKPPLFGQTHLNYMKISFREESGQSRAPTRSAAPSKSKASISRPDEGQSSQHHSQPDAQSTGLHESIKKIVETAMADTFGTLQTTLTAQYYELSERLESEMGKLIEQVTSRQELQEDHLNSLDDRMDTMNGHFEDLGNRFDSMYNIYMLLDSKISKLMKTEDIPGPSRVVPSPPASPHPSPLFSSSPPPPESTPILPTPPVLAPFVSSAPPTVILPSPQTSTLPLSTSSGDTAALFDELSDSSIHPSVTPPRPASPLAVTSPADPSSLSLTIYSPLPMLQALRASLASGSPILPDDKGGEQVRNEVAKKK